MLATALLPLSASAATELVTNGDFETGDLTGWTCFGEDLCTAQTTYVHSGSYAFWGFDNTDFATLSQTVSTVTGTTYDFSFWSLVSELGPNIIGYSLDGGAVVDILETLDWSETTDTFMASGTSAVISLFFETDLGTGIVAFDDISVMAVSEVPLPASMVLLLGAIGSLGMAKRRRARS